MLLTLLLLIAPALADDPPAEPPAEAPPAEAPPADPLPDDDSGWLTLDVPADFGSALASALPPSQDPAARPSLAPEPDLPPPPAPLRGRWGLRPWLGATGLGGRWGGAAGASVSHQWWTLTSRAVQPAGETRLRALGAFGGVDGWDLSLESTHGAWLGPVGLLAGPALRAGALSADTTAPAALSLGPQARLALQLGPVVPWAAATPAWLLAGDRAPVAGRPWHELELAGGVALDTRPVGFRLSGAWRELSAGAAWEAALGLQLRVL